MTDKDIGRTASLFFAVRRLVRTKLADGEKLNPYAWLHIETMVYIDEHEGPSMSAIAEYLSITAPSATSLMSAMVKAGLVRRSRDARDARATRMYLTKKGEAFLSRKKERGHKALADIFSSLSKSELVTLNRLLAQVLAGKTK